MSEILLGGALKMTQVDTPTRRGEVIDTIEDIHQIPTPRVGMRVYVKDTKREYIITELKDRFVNGVLIPLSQVKEYVADNKEVKDMLGDLEDRLNNAIISGGAEGVDLTVYAKKEEVNDEMAKKQPIIADLEEIRQGAMKGATAIQEVKTINGVSMEGEGNVEIKAEQEMPTPVTYDEICTLAGAGELIPEKKYRITDYKTHFAHRINNVEYAFAEGQFDIVVTARDEFNLYHEAKAARHEGDTYFALAKVEDWELMYDCDNNNIQKYFSTPYSASQESKGVIYRMKDEWGNECGYDFKTIKKVKDGVAVFTFSYVNGEDGTILEEGTYGPCFKNNRVDGSIGEFNYFKITREGRRIEDCVLKVGCSSNEFDNCSSIRLTDCHGNTFKECGLIEAFSTAGCNMRICGSCKIILCQSVKASYYYDCTLVGLGSMYSDEVVELPEVEQFEGTLVHPKYIFFAEGDKLNKVFPDITEEETLLPYKYMGKDVYQRVFSLETVPNSYQITSPKLENNKAFDDVLEVKPVSASVLQPYERTKSGDGSQLMFGRVGEFLPFEENAKVIVTYTKKHIGS